MGMAITGYFVWIIKISHFLLKNHKKFFASGRSKLRWKDINDSILTNKYQIVLILATFIVSIIQTAQIWKICLPGLV